MITSLIKSGTTLSHTRSSVMPTDAFATLFTTWAENDLLSIKDLRLKTITLLSLYLMLRPSDIAPKSSHFSSQDQSIHMNCFSIDNVVFNSDGSALFTFFGIKNDLSRSGFQVTLQPHVDIKLDGVLTLKSYIDRTNVCRNACPHNAIFLTLQPPYSPLSASAVSNVLNNAIALAGLKDMGFTAKSFRPTGATNAISNNVDPKIVQQVGRWKSTDVFYQHYVHSKPPKSFSESVI